VSSKHRRIIVGEVPQFQGRHIQPSFSQQDPITFGFKHLDLGRGKFVCKQGEGSSLLQVLKNLNLFSKYNQVEMGKVKNYHSYSSAVIKQNNFEDIENLSPSKKVYQMGKKRTPERIIGFFESVPNNLFQVCVLDLKHKACPEQ
jgi:hypothetical protein